MVAPKDSSDPNIMMTSVISIAAFLKPYEDAAAGVVQGGASLRRWTELRDKIASTFPEVTRGYLLIGDADLVTLRVRCLRKRAASLGGKKKDEDTEIEIDVLSSELIAAKVAMEQENKDEKEAAQEQVSLLAKKLAEAKMKAKIAAATKIQKADALEREARRLETGDASGKAEEAGKLGLGDVIAGLEDSLPSILKLKEEEKTKAGEALDTALRSMLLRLLGNETDSTTETLRAEIAQGNARKVYGRLRAAFAPKSADQLSALHKEVHGFAYDAAASLRENLARAAAIARRYKDVGTDLAPFERLLVSKLTSAVPSSLSQVRHKIDREAVAEADEGKGDGKAKDVAWLTTLLQGMQEADVQPPAPAAQAADTTADLDALSRGQGWQKRAGGAGAASSGTRLPHGTLVDEKLLPHRGKEGCHHCGLKGHRWRECRKLRAALEASGALKKDAAGSVGAAAAAGAGASAAKGAGGGAGGKYVIDSGACSSVVGACVGACVPNAVAAPNDVVFRSASGHALASAGSGLLRYPTQGAALSVRIVPAVTKNLIAVSDLVDRGYEVRFRGAECEITEGGKVVRRVTRDPDTRQYIDAFPPVSLLSMEAGAGGQAATPRDAIEASPAVPVTDGAAPATAGEVPALAAATRMGVAVPAALGPNAAEACCKACQLHAEAGHVGYTTLRKTMSLPAEVAAAMLNMPPCEVCMKAKMTRSPATEEAEHETSEPLERVSIDIGGPFRVATVGGCLYYLVVVDNRSGKKWVFTLKEKSDAFSRLAKWLPQAERQSGRRLKVIRSDGAKELISAELQALADKEGIVIEVSPAHSPFCNGAAERANRTLNEVATACLKNFGGTLDPRLWGLAYKMAAYLRNNLGGTDFPDPDDEDKVLTPDHVFTGKRGTVKNLYPFGCKVEVKDLRPKAELGKLQDKSVSGIFVGYHEGTTSIYKVLTIHGELLNSRDVKFFTAETLPPAQVSAALDRIVTQPTTGKTVAAKNAIKAAAAVASAATKDASAPSAGGENKAMSAAVPVVGALPASAGGAGGAAAVPVYGAPAAAQAPGAPPAVKPAHRPRGGGKAAQEKAHAPVAQAPVPSPYKMRTGRVVRAPAKFEGLQDMNRFRALREHDSDGGDDPAPSAVAPAVEPAAAAEVSEAARAASAPAQHAPMALEPEAELSARGKRAAARAAANEAMRAAQDNGASLDVLALSAEAAPKALEAAAYNERPLDTVVHAPALATADPATHAEAMASEYAKEFKAAADDELASFKALGVYEECILPDYARAVKSRWVVKLGRDPKTGEPVKFRMRIVAKGYDMVEGVDFGATFAPVMSQSSLKTILALATHYGWEVDTGDVTKAYLNAKIEEEVYVQPPQGVKVRPGHVWKLLKAMYGTPQAARAWYKYLHGILTAQGYTRCKLDPCVYTRMTATGRVLLGVYVDDLCVAATSAAAMDEARSELKATLPINFTGGLNNFLGMQVSRDLEQRTMTLSQAAYARAVLEKFGMSACKAAPTPMATAIKPSQDMPVTAQDEENARGIADLKHAYMQLVGSLMYLSHVTRPDLSYAVGMLSRFASNPTPAHWAMCKRVLRYLKGTVERALVLGAADVEDETEHPRLVGYSDSDWATCTETRRSITGGCYFIGRSLVWWRSKKQPVVATSSVEAEYRAASSSLKEGVALWTLLGELQIPRVQTGILQRLDSQGAMGAMKRPVIGSAERHVEIPVHWIKEKVETGEVQLEYVPTAAMIADVFTKSLAREPFDLDVGRLGMTASVDAELGSDAEEDSTQSPLIQQASMEG